MAELLGFKGRVILVLISLHSSTGTVSFNVLDLSLDITTQIPTPPDGWKRESLLLIHMERGDFETWNSLNAFCWNIATICVSIGSDMYLSLDICQDALCKR